MELKIKTYKEHEDDFYTNLGRFFANRKYAKEMGGWQFYTQDKAYWFVAYVNDKVAGFCSALFNKTHIYFDNFYVLKQHRGKGISIALSKVRFETIKQFNKEIRVISDNPIQFKKYLKDGFVQYGKRGRYSKFKWHPNTNASTS